MGEWEANNPLTLIFRDSNTQSSWVCHVVLTVKSQTGGTFSGFVNVQGGNDKYCTYGVGFTAEMNAAGTIASVHPDGPFVTAVCQPISETTFTGTASSLEIRIDMKDRATCVDLLGNPHDTDRTFTIQVKPRSRTTATVQPFS
jgi:hypothetical protein